MRTHGVAEDDYEAEELAAFMLEAFDDDAEVILSGYLVAQTESDDV